MTHVLAVRIFLGRLDGRKLHVLEVMCECIVGHTNEWSVPSFDDCWKKREYAISRWAARNLTLQGDDFESKYVCQ